MLPNGDLRTHDLVGITIFAVFYITTGRMDLFCKEPHFGLGLYADEQPCDHKIRARKKIRENHLILVFYSLALIARTRNLARALGSYAVVC